MARQLDLSNPITFKDRATAYFEDIIYQLFQAVDREPVDVLIVTGVATIDLSQGHQFNITATSNFVLDIIGVEDAVDTRNAIDITNPAGAFDITSVTVPAGVTGLKAVGSTYAILGGDRFTFSLLVPDDETVQIIPTELEPL